MTAAIIALAALAAGLGGALVFVLVDNRRIMSALVSARAEVVAEQSRGGVLERERDAAFVQRASAEQRAAAALVRLTLAEARANEAAQEATRRVVETIRAKNAADAVAALDELLGAEILPQADPTGTRRDGR